MESTNDNETSNASTLASNVLTAASKSTCKRFLPADPTVKTTASWPLIAEAISPTLALSKVKFNEETLGELAVIDLMVVACSSFLTTAVPLKQMSYQPTNEQIVDQSCHEIQNNNIFNSRHDTGLMKRTEKKKKCTTIFIPL